MTFAHPAVLLLLPVAMLLALLWQRFRGPGPTLLVADLHAFQAAAAGRPSWRLRLRRLPTLLRWLALAVILVAIARPQRGVEAEPLPNEGIDIVLALDISGSMDSVMSAGTGQRGPPKIDAARDALTRFVSQVDGGNIGLVIFRSRALTLSPLTEDYEALQRMIDEIDSGYLPQLADGTAIGLGLAEALNLIERSDAQTRVVILATDGENNAGEIQPLQAAQVAKALGIRVYTVGVLTSASSTTEVNEGELREIARLTGGIYQNAATQPDLVQVYREVAQLERGTVGELQFTRYVELAPLLALLAMTVLALELALRTTALRVYPMTFGEPVTLCALALLVPLAMLLGHERRRARAADRAYGGSPALRVGRSRWRTMASRVLVLIAVALLIMGAARPRWGTVELPFRRTGIDVVIALDISRSMLAADEQPSRAEAAASALTLMLEHMPGHRVGLVTFGGTPFARSPLTLDLPAVAFLVGRAQQEAALVAPGSDLGLALTEALRLLDVPDRARTQVVVLASDGEVIVPEGRDAEGPLAAALQRAESQGVRVFTVAVGSEAGAPIPDGSDLLPSAPGQAPDLTYASPATLRRISEATGGAMRDPRGAPGFAVEFNRLERTDFEQANRPVPADRFPWFLGAALVAALLSALLSSPWRWFRAIRLRPHAPASSVRD